MSNLYSHLHCNEDFKDQAVSLGLVDIITSNLTSESPRTELYTLTVLKLVRSLSIKSVAKKNLFISRGMIDILLQEAKIKKASVSFVSDVILTVTSLLSNNEVGLAAVESNSIHTITKELGSMHPEDKGLAQKIMFLSAILT